MALQIEKILHKQKEHPLLGTILQKKPILRPALTLDVPLERKKENWKSQQYKKLQDLEHMKRRLSLNKTKPQVKALVADKNWEILLQSKLQKFLHPALIWLIA